MPEDDGIRPESTGRPVGRQAEPPEVPLGADSLLEAMLWSSEVLALARFSAQGHLQRANPRFAEIVQSAGDRSDRTDRDPVGIATAVHLRDLVIVGQRELIDDILADPLERPSGRLVHFARGTQLPVTLCVTFSRVGDALFLLGEPTVGDLEQSQEVLLRLNRRVSELARENAKKSAELATALTDLRQAQALLVHRAKMAALGQMTAGIAHELNNPLAYVRNNQFLLRRGFDDLLGLINLFGDGLHDIAAGNPGLYDEIMAAVAGMDLPHLTESIPVLLTAADEGIDRAAALVQELRTFSRLDEAEVKTIDINESVRSVVEFARFLAKENETTVLVSCSDLPPVTCAPAQVNQALLNILTNAIQAARRGGHVEVGTRREGDQVTVYVADDGPGIPDDIKERVFEPFFTTRPVGEGTGLGLSIAHSVVDTYGGSIDVGDGPDAGTVFTVRLPIDGGHR